jgi:hypothetical protein
MADDSDYARRITSLRQQSLADLAGARADPVALRTALARFFRRGTQLGFSDAESVDFLGVTSPSILELAGFSDDAEQHAMSLVSQLTDLDIHQAWPTRSLLLLAPRRGRSELKVDSGASPRWCALDYSAETDSFGSLFSVQPAPEADRDTLRWLPDVAGGSKRCGVRLREDAWARPQVHADDRARAHAST